MLCSKLSGTVPPRGKISWHWLGWASRSEVTNVVSLRSDRLTVRLDRGSAADVFPTVCTLKITFQLVAAIPALTGFRVSCRGSTLEPPGMSSRQAVAFADFRFR